MLRLCLPFALLTVSLAFADDDEFKPLFDGQTLEGWVVKADKPAEEDSWVVKDGVLTANPGANWLSTKEVYGDFILQLEWRVPRNGNSGVFVRVPDLKAGEHPHEKGIEIQVLDDTGDEYAGKLKPWQYSGSIYGAVPAENSQYAGPGEWNRYEITCQANRITVAMNGRKVAEGDVEQIETLKPRPRKGYIGLQNHGTGVEYRNIRIKVLK